MEYRSFDEIDFPILTQRQIHHIILIFENLVLSKLKILILKAKILNKYSPGRPVSHNYMGHFVEFDHREVSKDLDITAWNSYPLGNLQNMQIIAEKDKKLINDCYNIGDPDFQSYHHDLYRGMGSVMDNGTTTRASKLGQI